MERRTFLTTMLGAGALAACGGAAESTVATVEPTPPTPPPTDGPTTTTVPAASPAPTTVATPVAEPVVLPAPPSSDTWWLDANFAPVSGELDATDLVVRGTIPAGLNGRWFRNGPNPQNGMSSHWFVGDGMIHALRIEDGAAGWYGRRYVQTPYVTGGAAADELPGGVLNKSNVSLRRHAGRLLSFGEIGHPYQIDPSDGSTIGAYDFGGGLGTSMTAHPKIDPVTGEMFFFGYDFRIPFLTAYVADASGELARSFPITLPSAPFMHDVAITEKSMVFLGMGIHFSLDGLSDFPYLFDPSYQCRIGVLPRDAADESSMQWFDVESGYVFHTINAHESNGLVTLDVIRYPELWVESSTDRFASAAPYRYTIDLVNGRVTEGPLDDRFVEFPMIDRDRVTGRSHTKFWTADMGPNISEPRASTVVGHLADGSVDPFSSYRLPGEDVMGEALFATDPDGSDEGDGWLLVPVLRVEQNRSDLIILDARDVAGGPVATIEIPDRIPHGFHAEWVPG